VAVLVLPAAGAHGGSAGPTISLGKSRGLEYMKAKHENVITQAGAPANCDGDASVIGGGGSISGPSGNAMLNASYPVTAGEGWQAEGRGPAGSPRTVATYALCGVNDVTFSSDTVPLIPGGSFNRGVECTGSEQRIGGGLRGVGGNVVIRGLVPHPDNTYDWISRTVNLHATQSANVTFYDACTSSYDLRYRDAAERVADGQQGKVTARCTRREAVAAGGFEWTRGGSFQPGAWAVATQPWDSNEDAGKVPDDGWRIRSHNDSGQRMKLTAYAICKHPLEPDA
jgi:hypothetical protein